MTTEQLLREALDKLRDGEWEYDATIDLCRRISTHLAQHQRTDVTTASLADDEILAAAGEWDIFIDSVNTLKESPTAIFDLYRAAYAAGMEAAAQICDGRAKTYGLYSDDVSLNRSLGSGFCADAIRAANGREAT